MKKLMLMTVLVSASFFASAQYANNRNFDNDNHSHKEGNSYNSRMNDRNWGYDRNYNQVRGKVNTINSFQFEARQRIATGIVNGTINSREAERLLAFAERIELKENRFMRNGRLNPNEVNELKSDLAELNRMISREMRDGNQAPVDRTHRN